MTPKEAIQLAQKNGAVMADLKFMDYPGMWQHFSVPIQELKEVPQVPDSLAGALDALERDHEFLLKGDVFTRDAIRMWIDYKRERELDPIRLWPVPLEFQLYFDI